MCTLADDIIFHFAACISRPDRELKGFQRIHLAKGESKTVTFDVTPDLLSFYAPSPSSANGCDLQPTIEPGKFEIYVGSDCRTTDKAEMTLR